MTNHRSPGAGGERKPLAGPEPCILRTDGITLSAEIECGNACDGEILGPRHVAVGPGDDGVPLDVQRRGVISCCSVCALLRNEAGHAQDLILDVKIPSWMREAGFGYFLEKPCLQRPEHSLDWAEIPSADQATGATL